VVAVPFYELAAARRMPEQQQESCHTSPPGQQHGGGDSWCLTYVSKLVDEHCNMRL
jgi:hypothetical protein